MGGFGSTRWNFTRTRTQVESCLILAAPRKGAGVLESTGGVYRWPRYGLTLAYTLSSTSAGAWMRLHGAGIAQAIEIEATPANRGGLRHWFRCPRCDARALKLYKPPRAWCFLCRRCHDLSYESAQNSGAFYYEIYKIDARAFGCSSRIIREAIRGAAGGYVVEHLVGVPEPIL